MKKNQDEESIWSIDVGRARRGAGSNATFVRIAASIVNDIRRGALGAGDKLPSTRGLADRLDVNRNTIVAAFDELAAEGWVVTRGSKGTFVCDEVPERSARRHGLSHGMAARPGFPLRTMQPPSAERATRGASPNEARYQMSAGVPDTRLLPTAMLARAYRRALRTPSARGALDYADALGSIRLRTAIARMLRTTRGIPADPENVLVTRGSQMALDLVARALLRPGERALVEELGYRPAWDALAEAGARLTPVALDSAGLVVAELAGSDARCLYTTPHHQYPTTVVLSPARRAALLAHARETGLAIIEDDYDHEFHFDGRPVAPLAAADRGANVLYVGTLSKTLAPGLRLGFVAASSRAIAELAKLRAINDRQGDQVLENAVAELMEDGELARHVRKMRRIYAGRRAALASAIQRDLGDALVFELPAGGITLWARVADGISVDAWQRAALARGVAFATARQFDISGRASPFVRIAFARHDETELVDAVRRMRRALGDVYRTPRAMPV
jgi:GntR family transcriptional regulator / MocR family aminotransferase